MFRPPLPPYHIIHYQVHQNLCGTGQDITVNVSQPNAGVHNVPDQFRIIAAFKGGGGGKERKRLLPLIQAEA